MFIIITHVFCYVSKRWKPQFDRFFFFFSLFVESLEKRKSLDRYDGFYWALPAKMMPLGALSRNFIAVFYARGSRETIKTRPACARKQDFIAIHV